MNKKLKKMTVELGKRMKDIKSLSTKDVSPDDLKSLNDLISSMKELKGKEEIDKCGTVPTSAVGHDIEIYLKDLTANVVAPIKTVGTVGTVVSSLSRWKNKRRVSKLNSVIIECLEITKQLKYDIELQDEKESNGDGIKKMVQNFVSIANDFGKKYIDQYPDGVLQGFGNRLFHDKRRKAKEWSIGVLKYNFAKRCSDMIFKEESNNEVV